MGSPFALLKPLICCVPVLVHETGGLLFSGVPSQTLIAVVLLVQCKLDTSSRHWTVFIPFVQSLRPDVKQAEVQQFLP